MATIDDLSVRVSADTATFNAGMDRVQDNLEEVDDEARKTARSFTALSASTNGLSLSFGVLGTSAIGASAGLAVLSTALLPLAATFAGLAAAVGAVAGAFGILVGAGVVTHMSELQTALQETKEEVLTLIEPLGEVFGPVLVDAVEAIPSLVEESLAAIGSVEEFRNVLVEFGAIAADVIPSIVGFMFELARRALPLVREGFAWIRRNGPRIFDGIMRIARRLGPMLLRLGQAIARIIPELTTIGLVVATTIIPAITRAITVFDKIISSIIQFAKENKQLRKDFVSAIKTINSVARDVLGGLQSFWDKWGEDIIGIVRTLYKQASSFLGDLFGALEETWNKVGKPLLGEGGEIEGALNSLKKFWDEWGDEISTAFSLVFDSIITVAQIGFDLLLTAFRVILDVIQGDWEGALNAIAGFFSRTFNNLLGFASKWGGKFIDAIIGALPKQLREGVRDAIGAVSSISVPEIDVGLPAPQAQTGGGRQENVVVERREVVEFEGDDQITQAMADQANRQMEQKELRTERNSGSQYTP